MENLTIYRIFTISTSILLLTSILTPLASIIIDLSRSSSGLQYLEFVCVWCQYGSVDSNPNGFAMILNFTSIDFYFLWIPLLLLFLVSLIPTLKSFPTTRFFGKISDNFAINLLWCIAAISLIIRFLLSYLVNLKEKEFQQLFPDNFVRGELGWGAASLIIAAIFAASSAMFGFIEFQYQLDDQNSITKSN